jgi:hypothetical protein
MSMMTSATFRSRLTRKVSSVAAFEQRITLSLSVSRSPTLPSSMEESWSFLPEICLWGEGRGQDERLGVSP